MGHYIGESKEQLLKQPVVDIKQMVEKDAWVSLRQYFCGAGNGPEAKVACVVIGTLAREEQAKNNARQLDLLERRFKLELGPGTNGNGNEKASHKRLDKVSTIA